MTYDDSFDVQEEDLESWVLVSSDWWQCSHKDVEWACGRRYHWTETGVKLTIHPRPPLYHDTLYNDKDAYGVDDDASLQDLELNRALVGVKVVEDALEAYERDVGICDYDQASSLFSFNFDLLLPEDASEDVFRHSREEWARHVDDLLGGILEPSCFDLPACPLDDGVRMWDMDALEHSYDSDISDVVDLTYSDTSAESDPMPTTPPGDKKSYAEVLFDDSATPAHAGTVVSPLPSKPLNASALSFIPSFYLEQYSPPLATDEPYVSPTYEFHFPSLGGNTTSRTNTRSLPPSLQRDEHGFYNEVPSESTQSATQSRSATPKRATGAAVPAFLGSGSRQGSKTREMVDRLRSSSGGSRRSRKNKAEAAAQKASTDNAIPQTSKDADGWITGVQTSQPQSSHKRSKSHKSGDWVEGLFQCRSQTKQEQNQRNRKRSTSNTTTSSPSSTNQPSPTPSSVSSTLSTIPSPTSSTFSNPLSPTNAQFPPHQFYAFQPPYAAYPGTYSIPPPGLPMMQAPWQVGPMVPAHAAYVLPPPMYGPSASPYDTRKA